MMTSKSNLPIVHHIGACVLVLVALLAYESQLFVAGNLVDLINSDQVKSDQNAKNDNSPLGKLITRFGQQPLFDFRKITANANELKNPDTLKSRLGDMFNNAVAPVKTCASLVTRYHNWHQNYKKLQKESPVPLKDPMKVLKEEYTKVDEELNADASASNENSPAEQKEDTESMGHIFKALKVVIDRLEAKLVDQEERQGLVMSTESGPIEHTVEVHEHVDEERVKRAMDRVKSALITAGKALIIGESAIIARTAVYHALAQYYAAKPDTGDALDQLRPIVALLGSAATPVAVSYLMGIQFRAAIATFNAMNPLSLFDKEPKRLDDIDDDFDEYPLTDLAKKSAN